jgi:hypothetical protein
MAEWNGRKVISREEPPLRKKLVIVIFKKAK